MSGVASQVVDQIVNKRAAERGLTLNEFITVAMGLYLAYLQATDDTAKADMAKVASDKFLPFEPGPLRIAAARGVVKSP